MSAMRSRRRIRRPTRMRSSPNYNASSDSSDNESSGHSPDSSGSSFNSSDSEMDLERELKPIGLYMKDKPEMVRQMFRAVKGKQLKQMMPPILSKMPIEELQQLCTDELEIMSKKRIRNTLAGQDMSSSSGTDESSETDDEYSKNAYSLYRMREIFAKRALSNSPVQPDSTTNPVEDVVKTEPQAAQAAEVNETENDGLDDLEDGDDIILEDEFEDSPMESAKSTPHYGELKPEEELDFSEDSDTEPTVILQPVIAVVKARRNIPEPQVVEREKSPEPAVSKESDFVPESVEDRTESPNVNLDPSTPPESPIRVQFDDKIEPLPEDEADEPDSTVQKTPEKILEDDRESFPSDTEPEAEPRAAVISDVVMPTQEETGTEQPPADAEATSEWPPPPPTISRVPWAEGPVRTESSSDSDTSSTTSEESVPPEREMTPEDLEHLVYGDAGSDDSEGEILIDAHDVLPETITKPQDEQDVVVVEPETEQQNLPDSANQMQTEEHSAPPTMEIEETVAQTNMNEEQMSESQNLPGIEEAAMEEQEEEEPMQGCDPPPEGWKVANEWEEGEIREGERSPAPVVVEVTGESQKEDKNETNDSSQPNENVQLPDCPIVVQTDGAEPSVSQENIPDPSVQNDQPEVQPDEPVEEEVEQEIERPESPMEGDLGDEEDKFFGDELFQVQPKSKQVEEPGPVERWKPPAAEKKDEKARGSDGELEGYDSDQSGGLEEGELVLPPGMEEPKESLKKLKLMPRLPPPDSGDSSPTGGRSKKTSIVSIKTLYKQLKAQREAEKLKGPPKVYGAELRKEELEAKLLEEEQKKKLKEQAKIKPAGPDKPPPGIEWDYENPQVQEPVKKKKKKSDLLTPEFLADLERKKLKHQQQMKEKASLLEKLRAEREQMVRWERETKDLAIKERKFGPLKREPSPEPVLSDEEVIWSSESKTERLRAREEERRRRKSAEKRKRHEPPTRVVIKVEPSPPRPKSPTPEPEEKETVPAADEGPFCNAEEPTDKPAVEPEPEAPVVEAKDPELELYELELRARAIKALMKRNTQDDDNEENEPN